MYELKTVVFINVHHCISYICIYISYQNAIKAAILEGGAAGVSSMTDLWVDITASAELAAIADIPVICAAAGDAAVGGCVLSAAELPSSKEYLQREDGEWIIAHMVSMS